MWTRGIESRIKNAGLLQSSKNERMKIFSMLLDCIHDNIKQNVLEPLHHLQTKDIKEVLVRNRLRYVFLCAIMHEMCS